MIQEKKAGTGTVKRKLKKNIKPILISFIILLLCAGSLSAQENIPSFDGHFIVELNDNYPEFSVRDLTTQSYAVYSDLDELGRAGAAMACIGKDSFPQTEREPLDEFAPSGLNNAYYDFIEDGFVYNRCHLIGYQLTGNDSINNLITGTRYLNYEGMLPYENWVAMYVSNTGNHVLYRVTPVYCDDNLVASAVQMEGYSVEDLGAGICFNILIYNVQPGVGIDYADGQTWEDDAVDVILIEETFEETETEMIEPLGERQITYILNTGSMKFHYTYCDSVAEMKEKNRAEFYGTREEVLALGYEPCGWCKP